MPGPVPQRINLTSDVLFFLVAVIAVALVGGFVPAVLEAIAGSLLLNYYFTPPIHQFTIAEANNALALGIFVIVGLVVSSVVDGAARRSKQAARASAESELLVTAAGSVLRGQQALTAVLDRVREAFGMESVTLLERASGPAGAPRGPVTGWVPVATSGGPELTRPEDADVDVPVTDSLTLGLRGRALPASDRRVLGAFAAYAAAALEQQRLAAEAEAARPIAEADRMRTALLAAVSHDLRTPLASAKAAVTSLRSRDVRWNTEDRDELLATADESLDRLARLVDNLLDMSRLQAGALSVFPRPADLEEVVSRSLDDLGPAAREVIVDMPATLPEVQVDPAILERVIANVTANALRYSPEGSPPRLTASAHGRPGGTAHRGPRARDSRDRPGPDLRALPAARRHRQHHGRGAGARAVPRPDRGDGRHPGPGGHPGGRADHGDLAARGARSRARAGAVGGSGREYARRRVTRVFRGMPVHPGCARPGNRDTVIG